jgi:hypothetical protein
MIHTPCEEAKIKSTHLFSEVVKRQWTLFHLRHDRRSVGQSVLVSSLHLGPKTRFLLLSDRCGFVDVRRLLWWKDGSCVTIAAGPRQRSHVSIYLSTVLLLDLGHLFSFLILYRVGLLGQGISPSEGRYLHTGHDRINAHTHPCLEWDSNPRSQRSSERRQFMPWTARPLWLAEPYLQRSKSVVHIIYI